MSRVISSVDGSLDDWGDPPPNDWEMNDRYVADYSNPEVHPYRESARRAAMFAKAERVLTVAALVAGSRRPEFTVQAWYRNNGQRIGLFVGLPGEREMTWSPRNGYRVGEVVYGELPF